MGLWTGIERNVAGRAINQKAFLLKPRQVGSAASLALYYADEDAQLSGRLLPRSGSLYVHCWCTSMRARYG